MEEGKIEGEGKIEIMVSSTLLERIAKHAPTFTENVIYVAEVSNTPSYVWEDTNKEGRQVSRILDKQDNFIRTTTNGHVLLSKSEE